MTGVTLRVALAQISLTAGDLDGNGARIAGAIAKALAAGADILLTPEMAISGYPVEDLLGEHAFLDDVEVAVAQVASAVPANLVAVIGAPVRTAFLPVAGGGRPAPAHRLDANTRDVRNAALLACGGAVVAAHTKSLLPTSSVFDDSRWVLPGPIGQDLFTIGGARVGVAICEDVWSSEVADAAAAAGAQVLLVINASPYYRGKPEIRLAMLAALAARTGMVLCYTNASGGQDELVFDGGSLVLTPDGQILLRAPLFTEGVFVVDIPLPSLPAAASAAALGATPATRPALVGVHAVWPTGAEALYAAVVLGLRDYVNRNGARKVVLGLSGGLDSALAAVIATDALGPARVWGVAMPGPYSSPGSVTDALALAANLGIRCEQVSIQGPFEAELKVLGPLLDGPGSGVARENIQARLRSLVVLSLANAAGSTMMVNTGNRSEAAVGYFTLGGDSCGGFAPLRDVSKTTVYELARWRNEFARAAGRTPPIPASTLTKPPSAELAPGQVDTSSLPAYDVLDDILEGYLEDMFGPDELVARLVNRFGMDAPAATRTVLRTLAMVDRAEHKRRQVAPGIKLTRRQVGGRDRRVPITNRRAHHTTERAGTTRLGRVTRVDPGAG